MQPVKILGQFSLLFKQAPGRLAREKSEQGVKMTTHLYLVP
jgi:hypothetical protein